MKEKRKEDKEKRIKIGNEMDDIEDEREGGRCKKEDEERNEGKKMFKGRIEKELWRKEMIEIIKKRNKREREGGLNMIDEDMIFGWKGIGGEIEGGDKINEILGEEEKEDNREEKDKGLKKGKVIIKRKIGMEGRMREEIEGNIEEKKKMEESVIKSEIKREGNIGKDIIGKIRRWEGKNRIGGNDNKVIG